MNAWGPAFGAAHRCISTGSDTGLRVSYLVFGAESAAVQSLPHLPAVLLPEGSSDVAKTFAAFTALSRLCPNASWYMKADDDTLLVLENLAVHLFEGPLASRDVPAMGGCQLGNFFSGGAGYLLTHAALQSMLPVIPTLQCNEPWATRFEDVQSILCARSVLGDALRMQDIPGMWMSLPENALRWWRDAQAPGRARAAVVSVHHMLPDMMHAVVTPAFPAHVLHLVELSRPHPLQECKRVFAAAGWRIEVWGTSNTGAMPFWHMYKQLSDDAFERLVGVWAVLRHGGVWLAPNAECDSASPTVLEGLLGKNTTLLSLPSPDSLQAVSGPLSVPSYTGQCAVAIDSNSAVVPAFLACSKRSDFAARLVRYTGEAVAGAGQAVEEFSAWSPSAILRGRQAIDSLLSSSTGQALWARGMADAVTIGAVITHLPADELGVVLPSAERGFPELWPPRRAACSPADPALPINQPLRYVTTTLRGGLGNQLFMASAALIYAWSTGRCLVLPDGDLNPHRQTSWPYSYTVFSRIFTDEWSLGPLAEKDDVHTMEEPSGAFGYTPFEKSESAVVRLVGYFQHHAYHAPHKVLLQSMLGPPEALKQRLLDRFPGLATGVAIHVRRGDYLTYGGLYPIPNIHYYDQAIKRVLSGTGTAGTTFYIFTDDWEWAKNRSLFSSHSLGGTVVFCEGEDEVTSLYMMSLAALGIVCPNSSFCWWAAMLGPAGRPTVFPSEWYSSEGVNTTGIYPPGAIVMSGKADGGENLSLLG